MKGLMLKDLYMLRAYCKSYVLIIAVFLAASLIGNNVFFIYYPCLICGMIPINLLAYDEHAKFVQYSASLPVSRKLIVSEKYIIGLLTQAAVLLITGIVQGIRMTVNNVFKPGEFAVTMLSLLLVSMLASAIPLPFIFKSGIEKGRIAYYVTIGLVAAAGILFSEFFKYNITLSLSVGIVFALMSVIGIGIYCLSWYLSVVFYKKREL